MDVLGGIFAGLAFGVSRDRASSTAPKREEGSEISNEETANAKIGAHFKRGAKATDTIVAGAAMAIDPTRAFLTSLNMI